jgi:hypothetical protein
MRWKALARVPIVWDVEVEQRRKLEREQRDAAHHYE